MANCSWVMPAGVVMDACEEVIPVRQPDVDDAVEKEPRLLEVSPVRRSYQLFVRCATVYPFRSLDIWACLRLAILVNVWGRSSVLERLFCN